MTTDDPTEETKEVAETVDMYFADRAEREGESPSEFAEYLHDGMVEAYD